MPSERARYLMVVLVFLGVFAAMAPASGRDVSRSEFRALARRAIGSGEALESLRGVDSVEDRPVDLGSILDDAEGTSLDARLRTLGAPDPSVAIDPAEARAAADEILAGRSYGPPPTPRPFRGLIETVERWLRSVGRWLSDLADSTPGGPDFFWGAIALLVVLVAAISTVRIAARASPGSRAPSRMLSTAEALDPKALERTALEAERNGNYELSMRLLFRAGLVRLDAAGVIRFRPSITSKEVARSLRSSTFDDLARRFDLVVYGGRRVDADATTEARAGWARLREEVKA